MIFARRLRTDAATELGVVAFIGAFMEAPAPGWPTEKIYRNLSSLEPQRVCVLVATGALNPVHKGDQEQTSCLLLIY